MDSTLKTIVEWLCTTSLCHRLFNHQGHLGAIATGGCCFRTLSGVTTREWAWAWVYTGVSQGRWRADGFFSSRFIFLCVFSYTEKVGSLVTLLNYLFVLSYNIQKCFKTTGLILLKIKLPNKVPDFFLKGGVLSVNIMKEYTGTGYWVWKSFKQFFYQCRYFTDLIQMLVYFYFFTFSI